MIEKEKYKLFEKYYIETNNVKKALETKANITISLLSILLSGYVFKLDKIVEIIADDNSSIFVLILFSIVILVPIFSTLIYILKAIKGKPYRLMIPDNYMELFFIKNLKNEKELYNNLLKQIRDKVELNSSFNKKKSRQIHYSQVALLISYLITVIYGYLILVIYG